VLTNWHSEVRAIAIDEFKRCLRDACIDTGVQGEFCSREIFGPVFLIFVTEKTEVLFYFLVLALNFAISFRMVGSSEASFDTKMLVESTYKLGHKLWTAIREDFFWNSVKIENIPVVKVSSALNYQDV
jgi:hypothetical protein